MLLEVRNLKAGYGKKQVLHGLSLSVAKGEIVGLIGHNGAGKSTTLKATFGLIRPSAGEVVYEGRVMTHDSPGAKLDAGIYHIPQENFLFNDLGVKENLEMSYFTAKDKSRFGIQLDEIYRIFPVFKDRQTQLAGTLSGGERRMLGIAMGLMREPSLILVDEPSSGLSPVAFKNVIQIIKEINNRGTAVFLVEQNVKVAFKVSQRVYVMKAGKIILEETGQKLLERKQWWDLF
jgi:branched-chain amino acid transport system ATP-binding protein